MNNSIVITPTYLSKICKIMKQYGVRKVTVAGLQVVMDSKEHIDDYVEDITKKEANPILGDPVSPPSTIDELDKLVELSAFEAFDNE